MSKIKVVEQDIIFLSYDEPNAEKNYADLISKLPWAKRVHGVKGSDNAHKACAAASETEYFVTVDADNIVDPGFFQVVIDLDELNLTSDNVFSWCGKVYVNGLMYGNGGLKMWTRKFVNEMRTHENAIDGDEKGKVEFCFDNRYYQFNDNYSTSYTNETPFQAWRAGFREGVKMSLDQGAKVNDVRTVWWQNYHRLLTWCNVGADVNNGVWSMLGAREGCYKVNCTNWDYASVRDFEWLTEYFNDTYSNVDDLMLNKKLEFYKKELRQICSLEIADLDSESSAFFKLVQSNAPRRLR